MTDHVTGSTGVRSCVEIEVEPGQAGVDDLMPALSAALDGTGPAIALVPRDGSEQYRARVRTAVRPGEPVPDGVAVVASTSGSTGNPAGVLLPGSALQAAARGFARRRGVTGHAWVAGLPLHHAGGLMVAVRAVVGGGPLIAMDSLGGARPFTVGGFVAATERALEVAADAVPVPRPIAVSVVPAMVAALAREPAGVRALGHYDAVLVGGAGTPAELVSRLCAEGARLTLSYGMTETCGGAVFDGRPLAGMDVAVDPDGRIRLTGDQVAAGYRDGRHPERWGVDAAGRRWFRTEDLGTVERGVLRVLGRADDVVQVGGASVSLGAVGDVIRADPRVAAAEVVALEDERLGARIHALVVPTRGACSNDTVPLADSLTDAVVAALGGAARPRGIRLVKSIPMLESGKPDRAELRRLAAEESRS